MRRSMDYELHWQWVRKIYFMPFHCLSRCCKAIQTSCFGSRFKKKKQKKQIHKLCKCICHRRLFALILCLLIIFFFFWCFPLTPENQDNWNDGVNNADEYEYVCDFQFGHFISETKSRYSRWLYIRTNRMLIGGFYKKRTFVHCGRAHTHTDLIFNLHPLNELFVVSCERSFAAAFCFLLRFLLRNFVFSFISLFWWHSIFSVWAF